MNQKSYLADDLLPNGMTVGEVVNKIVGEEKIKDFSLISSEEEWCEFDVANFYNVDVETIKNVTQLHEEELLSDGIKISYELSEVQGEDKPVFRMYEGYYNKRAILHLAMFLDNSIALEFRSHLIDSYLK